MQAIITGLIRSLKFLILTFRGFDFANHFVEYSINYGVDQPPFYELLPERFPSEEQMKNFMYSYEKELHPNASEKHLNEAAENMVKVYFKF